MRQRRLNPNSRFFGLILTVNVVGIAVIAVLLAVLLANLKSGRWGR